MKPAVSEAKENLSFTRRQTIDLLQQTNNDRRKRTVEAISVPGDPGIYQGGRPGPIGGRLSVSPRPMPPAKCAAKRKAPSRRPPPTANLAASSISELPSLAAEAWERRGCWNPIHGMARTSCRRNLGEGRINGFLRQGFLGFNMILKQQRIRIG